MERKIVELLRQNISSREIMKLLNIGTGRLFKVKRLAIDYGYLDEAKPLPAFPEVLFPQNSIESKEVSSEAEQKLHEKKDWIIDRLQAQWHPITIYEELGLAVGRSSFYRYLKRNKLVLNQSNRKRVVPEIVHEPGEALQLDWGKLRDVTDPSTGVKRTLWAFVGVLGYSRFLVIRLVWSNDLKTTLEAIERMFQEIAGVPKKITSDNPKCFSLKASRYEPILNPAFERFASYYNVLIECLPPADPQKKGKVERMMPFARRLFEAYGTQWHGLEHAQAYLDQKIAIANQRIHGATRKKPSEQFAHQEVLALKPLPALAYVLEEISETKVGRDGHVRFDCKYYSVSEDLIGKTVTILANQSHVSIYYAGKLQDTHQRLNAADNRIKSTKLHHRKPWEQNMENESVYLQRAGKIGTYCEQLVSILLQRKNGYVDKRIVWGILNLDKSFSLAAIDQACKQAIELESYSCNTVKRLIIGQVTDTSCSLVEIAPLENKFVRPLSVYKNQANMANTREKEIV